jgi:cytochrome b561
MTDDVIHYNKVARTLHWTIGALVIVNILLGITHDALKDVFPAMPLHESIGVTVLVLSLLRLYWRITHPAPPLPESVPPWQRTAARSLHWLFYALMIGMPLAGWIFTSAGKWPITIFWLFDLPKFPVTKDDPIVGILHQAHVVIGWTWGGLLLIHIGAALYHQFMLRDHVLNRMWRGAPAPGA